MSPDIDSFQSRNGRTEEYAVSHIGNAAHRLIRRLIAACRRPVFRQSQSQSSRRHRFKLPALIDDAGNGIGKYSAEDPVNHNRPYRNLARIGLSAGLTVYQVCQKVSVVIRKGYFRDIAPARLRRQP